MKKGFNYLVAKSAGLVAAIALAVGVASTNAFCFLVFHQPKVPQGMNKYKK